MALTLLAPKYKIKLNEHIVFCNALQNTIYFLIKF